MYELMKISDCCYYINCPSKMGIYVRENGDAYLVDSGNDKDAGKKAKKLLDAEGWNLKGILVTHAHADHTGGAGYLQTQTGCKVFAGGIEGAFAVSPILMPVSLYGGNPWKELCHKDMVAKPCIVSDFDDPEFPEEIEVIDLGGHSPEQVGYKMPDETVFIADALCTERTLDKYVIVYMFDIERHLQTLDKLESMNAKHFVPSHCDVSNEINDLVRYNRDKVLAIGDTLLELCREPKKFEDLLDAVFKHYELRMTYEQHELVGSTLKSYLTYLEKLGKLSIELEGNYLMYQSLV